MIEYHHQNMAILPVPESQKHGTNNIKRQNWDIGPEQQNNYTRPFPKPQNPKTPKPQNPFLD